MQPVLAILVLSELCAAIRVPIQWEGDATLSESAVPEKLQSSQTPIPNEYFTYTAQKPQFAIDVAAFHGVPSLQNHYKAYPVIPYTGQSKPEYGKHKIFDENKDAFQEFQQYVKKNEDLKQEGPAAVNYEVYHPYKAEEPALQQIYKDPVLSKIRGDIQNSQFRLQTYENDAGKPNIADDEYLEKPEQTDRKKLPQTNIPAPYEIHRPLRKPIYYRPIPIYSNREEVLNHRFRHPWNQNFAKIRPVHYRPLRNHLGRLRQHHAFTFDDEKNEYPQVPSPPQKYSEPEDGYDIYERGKEKFNRLRDNVDESINQAVKENRPTLYQKLELQNNGDRTETQISDDENEEEFVPVKNYAQVRKTETTKHLPRLAAFNDAENFDEVQNAPRLREAIKSTKAQTVYTEEGYEDAAYDHAGEQKHAEENEGHAGFLKEKEISRGKYQTPSVAGKYQEASGNVYRDQILDGKQWNNDESDKDKESESEDYAEDDHSVEADIYKDVTGRNKRENKVKVQSKQRKIKVAKHKSNEDDDEEEKSSESPNGEEEYDETEDETEKNVTIKNKLKPKHKGKGKHSDKKKHGKKDKSVEDDSSSSEEASSEAPKSDEDDDSKETTKRNKRGHKNEKEECHSKHDVNKRETNFNVPQINLTSTFLTDKEIEKISKLREDPNKEDIRKKYPYYFKNFKSIHKQSPLRYAENLKLIPKKSKGGTEFYDSRSQIECPNVDDDVDALPEKLKKGGHPDSVESDEDEDPSESKGHANFDQLKENPRLKGLGDKIDCFKAKYFGDNPLDSPFFKEELISNPEPITVPPLDIYKLAKKEPSTAESILSNVYNTSLKHKDAIKTDIFSLLDQLKKNRQELQDSLVKTNEELRTSLIPQNTSQIGKERLLQQSNVYSDVLDTIKTIKDKPILQEKIAQPGTENVSYSSFQNHQDVTRLPPTLRRKRASPFIYEPYKIIKEGQVSDTKKTTTTGNVSPLIKQLQSSKVADIVSTHQDKEQPVKRNIITRTYKDIGRKDREKNPVDSTEVSFIDVNVDKRRGEPRYELRHSNHKPNYTPVENKKAMSLEDYQVHRNKTKTPVENINKNNTSLSENPNPQNKSKLERKRPTVKSYFDVGQFLPKSSDVQKSSASNTVNRVVKPEDTRRIPNKNASNDSKNEEDEYEEYDDEQVDDSTTTTTTTSRPSFRRRKSRTTTTTTTTTTAAPYVEEEPEPELPKLRLITRFRNVPNKEMKKAEVTEKPVVKSYKDDDVTAPKYREKKKKSTKSTLVTDTKSYGEENDGDEEDDMRKKEVDSLIGIKHDMDEYVPNYEKEATKRKSPIRSKDDDEIDDEDEDIDEDDDDEYDDDSDEEFDYDDEEEDVENESDESEPAVKIAEAGSENQKSQIPSTTSEPQKHTIARTTETPTSTTRTHSARLESKPIVKKKMIEIHKELPANKSLPHVTQYKQDIKEVEIIKELPSKPKQRKPQKKPGVLEIYKDENLPKEVNKLGDVEIFKQNLDLTHGPKHGGNYRSAKLLELTEEVSTTAQPLHGGNLKAAKDADTSQSENKKLVNRSRSMHGGNLKSIDDVSKTRGRNRNAKYELADSYSGSSRRMHGGNLKSIKDKTSQRNNDKSEKLIELEEEHDDNDDHDTVSMHGGNFRPYSSRSDDRHGGNYRSAKLVQHEEPSDDDKKKAETKARSNAAVLLNSFAQAVPILTTTPAYILDPSKRMYYYVDT